MRRTCKGGGGKKEAIRGLLRLEGGGVGRTGGVCVFEPHSIPPTISQDVRKLKGLWREMGGGLKMHLHFNGISLAALGALEVGTERCSLKKAPKHTRTSGLGTGGGGEQLKATSVCPPAFWGQEAGRNSRCHSQSVSIQRRGLAVVWWRPQGLGRG